MHARRPAYRIFAEHFITTTVGLKISMNEFTQNVKEVKKKKCANVHYIENVLHWKSSVFENTGTIVRCSTGTHIFKPGSWNIS